MKRMSRRSFIKLGAGGTAAAALGSGLTTEWWGMDKYQVSNPGTEGDRIVPTFCEMCFWKCGVLAHVRDGRVTKIEGNPGHPLSRGRVCPRGLGGIGQLHGYLGARVRALEFLERALQACEELGSRLWWSA